MKTVSEEFIRRVKVHADVGDPDEDLIREVFSDLGRRSLVRTSCATGRYCGRTQAPMQVVGDKILLLQSIFHVDPETSKFYRTPVAIATDIDDADIVGGIIWGASPVECSDVPDELLTVSLRMIEEGPDTEAPEGDPLTDLILYLNEKRIKNAKDVGSEDVQLH